MASKEIIGLLTVLPDKSDPKNSVQEEIVQGNISFRSAAKRRTTALWNQASYPSQNPFIEGFPWKQAFVLVDDDITVGHAIIGNSNGNSYYPYDPSSSGVQMSTWDYSRFRTTGAVGTVPSGNVPRVMGSIGAWDNYSYATSSLFGWGDGLLSVTDVPVDYTQIGIVYQHPVYEGGTSYLSSSIGQNYVTFPNSSPWTQNSSSPSAFDMIRIENGSDAGYYRIGLTDYQNRRFWLQNLDGTAFVAQATNGSLIAALCPGRRAYFNETSIIPLSIGTVATGGRYSPRLTDPVLRESFIARLVFDKTGSTEAAVGGEQQGSYYMSIRPYTYGDGSLGSVGPDLGAGNQCDLLGNNCAGNPYNVNFFDGNPGVLALDWANQRMWVGYTNNANSSGIAMWKYKTCESFREIANCLGTPAHGSYVTPTPTLGANDVIVGGHTLGSNNWVYFGVSNSVTPGNAGVIIIKPDLTTLQYKVSGGFPSQNTAAVSVDKSRARTGTAGDTSTNGSNQVTSASGGFTNADIGRAIQLTGLGADSGTYKVATVVSGTQVTVQTMASGAVTFTSQSGGTFTFGDRIYLLFSNSSTGAGKINYMESLVPGTFLTRTVSMTNGANCNIGLRNGETQRASIDQSTGCLYWTSNDVQQQINKYDPTANTHSYLTIANVLSPSGGSPSNPGTPTYFTVVYVNSKFDDIWVSSDAWTFRIQKSNFTGSNFKRYYNEDSTSYQNPTGFPRSSGGSVTNPGSNHGPARVFREGPDGRMYSFSCSTDVWSAIHQISVYSHESDNWHVKGSFYIDNASSSRYPITNFLIDPYGRLVYLNCFSEEAYNHLVTYGVEVQYQWNSGTSSWYPMEWVPAGMPNKSVSDTTAPYANAKPIHSTLQDLIYGVKVQFNPLTTGSPPNNNQFLGRGGQSRVTAADGQTSIGTATFTGSGFLSSDVGRILRVESGADVNIYKVIAYLGVSQVTLSKMNGTAFSASATASGLTYTVWDLGTPQSNAGPEDATFMLADGFGKDNTQDITGISYEAYMFKTRLHENDEGRKFCVENPLPPAGSNGIGVYWESYIRASPQYDAALSHHKALPGSTVTNGNQIMDWILDKYLNGSNGRATIQSCSTFYNWYGTSSTNSVHGSSVMVDFGKNVEVGYLQSRAFSYASGNSGVTCTQSVIGLICNLYSAQDGSTPAASSAIRTSGVSNINISGSDVLTVTLSSGDFLGSAILGPNTNGVIVTGQNTFAAPAATFSQSNRMQILKITSGAGSDIGAYRITSVSSDGSTLTVRNLDQTAKVWTVSTSGVTYTVNDGVQEEDMLAIPSLASPTHKLCVERLTGTGATCQIRTGPNASVTNQSWQCVKPTWALVKRVSYNTEALPPEVSNNGTWVSLDGREQFNNADFKIYMDLTDLTPAQRTGRWFKMTFMPRYSGSSGTQDWSWSTFEFFDPSGNKMGLSKYTQTDESRSDADFLFNHVNRVDFIQSANDAMNGVSGYNGLANLGGANGDTITLAGGNTFLGFQVEQTWLDGNLPIGTNQINSATANFPPSAIIGRFIRVLTGTNAGKIYRVLASPTTAQVTLVTPSGSSVSWAGTETGIQFAVHEGFAVGGVYPDHFVFTSDQREFSILTVNDTLTTITITESLQPVRTNQAWEIRRPGYDTSSNTLESTKGARLVRPMTTYPIQTGDLCHDSRGSYRLFSEDIGSGNARSDGAITGGDGTFTGTAFLPDDVGRLLYIDTGVNKGIYEIQSFTSATSILVKNHYTGAAVSLTADAGPITYRVFGERRFRISKFVVGLRN